MILPQFSPTYGSGKDQVYSLFYVKFQQLSNELYIIKIAPRRAKLRRDLCEAVAKKTSKFLTFGDYPHVREYHMQRFLSEPE